MTERSTKRQKELLDYVDGFIKEHGYGPSYREVMSALGYKSVSTVAIHINGLIDKGYIRKRDNSARSLEVVSAQYGNGAGPNNTVVNSKDASKEKWLVGAVRERFESYKQSADPGVLDEIYVLVGSLKVLGFEAAYIATRTELGELIKR
ncbi:MAG: SOS-response transcriptional repressor, LexA [Candidatus Saccharibacteria bacterium]|nr:SOS-response transcriptional repressor, LexA [Candidatus Saccharibacteria bacterium]